MSRPRGLMDKASDFGSEDSRFESWRGRFVNFSTVKSFYNDSKFSVYILK